MNNSGKKFIVLSEVDSTNNYANQLILSDAADDGTVVLAHYQNNGRGQRGNHWESDANKNITASILFFPGFLPVENQFLISKIVCLGIFDFLSKKVNEVTIKWPNDIYIKSSKIGGVLIENSIKGKVLDSSIVGMGINLNQMQFSSDAPNPISLAQITGKNYPVEDTAAEIVKHIFEWYNKLKQGKLAEINNSYFLNLYRKEIWSQYKKGGKLFEGRIIGIGRFGQLQLELKSGGTEEFMFKEVEFVL